MHISDVFPNKMDSGWMNGVTSIKSNGFFAKPLNQREIKPVTDEIGNNAYIWEDSSYGFSLSSLRL